MHCGSCTPQILSLTGDCTPTDSDVPNCWTLITLSAWTACNTSQRPATLDWKAKGSHRCCFATPTSYQWLVALPQRLFTSRCQKQSFGRHIHRKVVFVWCSLNRVGKHQSLDFINCFVQLDLGCNFGIAMASQKHFHHAILVFFMLNDCQLSPWRCKRYTLQEVGFLYDYWAPALQ